MFCKVLSAAIGGVEGYPVRVEADVSEGMPGFLMVGYLASEVREAADRVRTALRNTGYPLPTKRITVNLARPASERKVPGLTWQWLPQFWEQWRRFLPEIWMA